ncbi:hypothetical protein FEM54_25745 [Pseudomonas edaphica]|uniref:Uncharacterized protein n=1 Tax=Pseudomonas edaphica TaxID=2006980 RepID=A0ABY2TYR4_9PSED|nr:hypothetical protein [Pseudomonas edaphica]TLG88596.1 hypothetical protein FEM54_25745 [Pseudomonas edaphica]
MSNGQTRFPYLLITPHKEVGMISVTVSVDGSYVPTEQGLYSFWTEKPFEDVYKEFYKTGKEFALIQVEDCNYAHAGGQLAGVIGHIN